MSATGSGRSNPVQALSSYRWVILLAGVLCQTAIAIPGQGIPALGYFFQTDLGLSRAAIGMFPTALGVGMMISGLVSGWLADRVAIRRLLLVGQMMIGVFVVAMSFSPSFQIALLLLVPVGLGAGMANPAITKAMLYWFPPRMRATAMSIKQTGVPIGGALAAATLPSIAIAFGWRAGVLAIGIGVIVVGIVSFLLYREYQMPAKGTAASRPGVRQIFRVLTRRDVLLASMVAAPLVAVQFAIITYFLLYLNEVLLFPVVVAGVFLSLTQFSAIGGRIFWGAASDFLFGGSRRKTMLVITSLGALVATVVAALPVGAPVWLVAIVAVAFGITAVSWHGVYMVQMGEVAGDELAGTAIGFALTITQIGQMFGPPLFGYIVDHTGSYRLAWLLMASFSALAALILLSVREQRVRR